jgi:hypothetical protein
VATDAAVNPMGGSEVRLAGERVYGEGSYVQMVDVRRIAVRASQVKAQLLARRPDTLGRAHDGG